MSDLIPGVLWLAARLLMLVAGTLLTVWLWCDQDEPTAEADQ